jgi:hypothetical protein
MPNEKIASTSGRTKDEKPNSPAQDFNKQNEATKPAERKTFKAGVINIQELVDAQAKDIAKARLSESKEDKSKGWLTTNWRKIWNHNLAKDFYNLREISRVKKEILNKGNLYEGEQIAGGDGGNMEHHKTATAAIIDRFTSKYAEEILKEEEKDSKKEVSDQVNIKIKDLINKYASGKINEDQFKEQKNHIIEVTDPNYAQEGNLYADNLLEIANEVKDAMDHYEGLDSLDFDVTLTLGKAQDTLNTQTRKNTFEKILNNKFMDKTIIGKSLSQNALFAGTVIGAYAGVKFLTRLAGKSLVASKWAGFFGGLAGGAAVEGIKENYRIKEDRTQDIRENAKGMKAESGAKRREEMEKSRYETKGASEIINQLDTALGQVERGNLTETEIREIMTNLSDLDARIRVGKLEKIDLISYKSFEVLEKNYTEMLEKSAELKVSLRNSGNPVFNNFDSEFKKLVDIQSSITLREGEKGIDAKNEAFSKLKTKKILLKMGQTMVFGGIFSMVTQEVTSAFTHEDGIVEGAFKGIRNHFDHTPGKGMSDTTTPLEALRRWMTHDGPGIPKGSTHEVLFGSTHMHLPEGVEMTKNPDGTYDLINQGKVISGITLGSDGNLSDASQDLLKANGIIPKAGIISEKITENVTRTAQDYLNQHPEATEQVHFKNWMGNDTEMYQDPNHPGHLLGADQNELRTHWAGINGTGVDANGDYVMTVAHMTNDGSFQDGLSVAAREQMAAGKLEAILSVTKEGQHHVFRIPVMPDGSFKVLHDSIPGQMLYSVGADGHADYDGYLLQIANPDGVAADGLKEEQLLGALRGNNNLHNVVDTVVKDTKAYNIGFDFTGNSVIEPPIPIPIVPREPLPRNYYKKDDASKQGPAKDKSIKGVNDVKSNPGIGDAVDPLKTGAEDLNKNEKVLVTESDLDENIKNARAEEAAVFAEFAEWEKNRKTPEERPSQDLEDRSAAAEAKVVAAEKAKTEFLEQKEKMDWMWVEDKNKGFGIARTDQSDYFYDQDGQTYWSKDKKTITDLIDKLNKGEEIESVSDLNKEPEVAENLTEETNPTSVINPENDSAVETEEETKENLDAKEKVLRDEVAEKRKVRNRLKNRVTNRAVVPPEVQKEYDDSIKDFESSDKKLKEFLRSKKGLENGL